MFGTYRREDVTLLLKDISGVVQPMPLEYRESQIQGGGHYSEMLPIEYKPSEAYMRAYKAALTEFSDLTAQAVANVSERIIREKGHSITLVSLARAGISIGVLIKKYLKDYYDIDASHYAVSIIRGRGIDANAMKHILARHPAQSIQFVDGWIGKGAIQRELEQAMQNMATLFGYSDGTSSKIEIIRGANGLPSQIRFISKDNSSYTVKIKSVKPIGRDELTESYFTLQVRAYPNAIVTDLR